MKKTAAALCLLLLGAALFAKGIQEDAKALDEAAKTSYAIGMVIGADLRQNGLSVDYAAFAEGLRAFMEGQPQFSQSEAEEIVQNALEAAMNALSVKRERDEADFLERNAQREGVTVTSSGLQYEVIAEGGGSRPSASDTVRVHYEGSLPDGTVFDSSYQRGEEAEIPLEMVIPGWAEGIQLMGVGSKYRLYIPSGLAYGGQGAGAVIPPFSTLVFTVELLGISEGASEEPADDSPLSNQTGNNFQ